MSHSNDMYNLGKTVGRAEGINEGARLLMRLIPVELRTEAAIVVMAAATSVAEQALEPGERAVAS